MPPRSFHIGKGGGEPDVCVPGGMPRYLEVRGDVREEEDAAARFQHQGREEESPDVSASGRLGPV